MRSATHLAPTAVSRDADAASLLDLARLEIGRLAA